MRASKVEKAVKKNQADPLYVIFEQHLYNFQDSDADRKTFISNIVKDYIAYLRKGNIVIPVPLEWAVQEELATQVSSMLMKKIYGCMTIEEYTRAQPVAKRKTATKRYSKLTRKTAK